MKTLAVYSAKGGVGKTATAVNLAYLAAQSGWRTLLWDLDPQAATTFYLRIHPSKGGVRKIVRGKRPLRELLKASDFPGLDVLPARFSFRHVDLALVQRKDALKRFRRLIKPLATRYDLLVFDCAPGLSLTAESVLYASTATLVPVIPTPLSLRTLEALVAHVDTDLGRRVRLWPFFSMVDARRQLHREICGGEPPLAVPPLTAQIPYASLVEQMGIERQPLPAFAPSSSAGKAYAALWSEVRGRLLTL